MGSLKIFGFSVLLCLGSMGARAATTAEKLNVLVPQRLSNINLIEQVDPLLWRLRPLVFKTLLQWDNTEARFKPALASAWSIETGKTELSFTLDPSARWEDGRPVTADDVVFSLGFHANPESKSIYRDIYKGFVEKAEALGSKRVRIKLKTSSYYHLQMIGANLQIYPRHIYQGAQGQWVWPKKWVGSGVYALRDFVADKGLLLQSRDKARPSMTVSFVPSLLRRLDEIKKGRANWAQLQWREALGLKKKKADSQYLWSHSLKERSGVIWMLLNHSHPHLADLKVRQAMMFGFDRQKVNTSVYDGSLVLGGGFWPSPHPYASPSRARYPYNPSQSIKLLKEAGYRDLNKDGYVEKGPKDSDKLEFRVIALTGEDGPLIDLFIQSMRHIGVNVKIEQMSLADAARRVSEGRYDAYLLHIPEFYEDLNLSTQFHSKRPNPWPVLSLTPSKQKRLDSLLERIEVEFVAEERVKLHRQVDEILSKELPSLFLYEIPDEYWLKNSTQTQRPF